MDKIIPTARPAGNVQHADPAVASVCALVDAAAAPIAVFDAQGNCLAASPAYAERGGRPDADGHATSRLIVTMGHELRTPLNAVIGFAEIMREELSGPLGAPEYKEYAGLIHRSGMALLELIGNLLDFARADAGILELKIADVELLRLLRSVAAGVREEAEAAGMAPPPLEVEPASGTLGIRADEQRLRQLLRALIGNALKSAAPGGRISVRAQKLPGGGAEVVVAESGAGMSAEGGPGRLREGAGIGLKLARQLAELHGGTLTLESPAGQGTRAILHLPHAPPTA